MVSSATGKAAVSTPFDSSEMAGHSSNGAARSDSGQTTTGPNINSANPPSGQANLLPQDNTRNTYQPNDDLTNLPNRVTIYDYEKKITDLLEKPHAPSAKDVLANVSVILEYMGGQQRLKDLIYNSRQTKKGEWEYIGEKTQLSKFHEKILHSAHVEGLWEIASLNTYNVSTMPPLSGQWSGKTWQSSKGLFEKLGKKVKCPLEGTFKMTIVGPGNDGRCTATLEDNSAANPAFIIHEKTQSCHLALESEVQKTSSSNEQIILYIRVVTAAVLVGQVRKAEKEHKAEGEFLLVKD